MTLMLSPTAYRSPPALRRPAFMFTREILLQTTRAASFKRLLGRTSRAGSPQVWCKVAGNNPEFVLA